MRSLQQFGQLVRQDMRVDLGRGDIRMSEQGLDTSQISSPHQQMCGVGMPERMRMDPVCADARLPRQPFQKLAEAPPRQMA